MTTVFPDIIRNQQDIIRRHGDTSHYTKAMEQALRRQEEAMKRDMEYKEKQLADFNKNIEAEQQVQEMQKTRQAKINNEMKHGLDIQTSQKRQIKQHEIMEMK